VSFRRRILLTALGTLAVGLGALVVAGNVLLALRVHAEATNQLRADADAQLAAVSVDAAGRVRVRAGLDDAALDRRAWVLGPGGQVVERADGVSAALTRRAIALGRAGRVGDYDGPGDLRFRVAPVVAPRRPGVVGSVVVAMSTAPLETLQQEVLVGSLIVAALVLLAGALALRGALDRALEPVAAMTDTARDWGAHDLERRFGLGPPHDELTGLAATLDGLLARIASSRRHEQRFAAEVAHELRTPIAGLRGRAELALAAGAAPDARAEQEAALRAVVAQADRLTTTVDTLLAVARRELDPGGDGTAADLAAVAREVDGVDVVAPADLPHAEGEPEVLRRALAPLVENARRHARSRVTLELSSAGDRVRLAVRDDGPGLEPGLGERAFDPGVRGATAGGGGAGLGLALARRLARSCGGDVRLGAPPGGSFVLELPAVTRPDARPDGAHPATLHAPPS
jgi:signal transduction histidine kinase